MPSHSIGPSPAAEVEFVDDVVSFITAAPDDNNAVKSIPPDAADDDVQSADDAADDAHDAAGNAVWWRAAD